MKSFVVPALATFFVTIAQAFPVPLGGIDLVAADQSTNGRCITRVIPENVDGVTATLNACRLGGVGQVRGELIDGIYQHTNPSGYGRSFIKYTFVDPVAFAMMIPEVHNSQASGYVLYGTDEASLIQIPIGGGSTSITLPMLTTDIFYVGAGSLISGAVIRFGTPPTFTFPFANPAHVPEPGTLSLMLAAALAATLALKKSHKR